MLRIARYRDHVGLWEGELRDWVPDRIFDAHVHLFTADSIGEIPPERRATALATFDQFTYEEALSWRADLYSGKTVAGMIAFPLPLLEVDLTAANDYIAGLVRQHPNLHGFLAAHPTDAEVTIAQFEKAAARGIRFSGVKPYYDLLGVSNYETTMPAFIPEPLLAFMNEHRLAMMLHTSGVGMGAADNQQYVRSVADRYDAIPIILAHMGRYLDPRLFRDFVESDVLDRPSIYLEMSSASNVEVYRWALGRRDLWSRLIFGSDLPFGLLTGIEDWSEATGPTFITRDEYPWTDHNLAQKCARYRQTLTYNTYHVIHAFKQAVDELQLPAAECERLKRAVFHDNAAAIFDLARS